MSLEEILLLKWFDSIKLYLVLFPTIFAGCCLSLLLTGPHSRHFDFEPPNTWLLFFFIQKYHITSHIISYHSVGKAKWTRKIYICILWIAITWNSSAFGRFRKQKVYYLDIGFYLIVVCVCFFFLSLHHLQCDWLGMVFVCQCIAMFDIGYGIR